MKKDLLNIYMKDQLRSMKQQIGGYQIDRAPERLHNLRVAIKKIKAILYFAKQLYQEKYSGNKLKPLFTEVGIIREIQIHTLLLNKFPQPPEKLLEQLKAQENILILKFLKHGVRYVSVIKKFHKKVALPKQLPDQKTIIRFFGKEMQRAHRKLEQRDRVTMHQYRTQIKRLMYIYDALPKSMQKKIDLNATEINTQQNKLGIWHDNYAALQFLSHLNFPINETAYMLKWIEEENRQFEALFKS